MATYQTTAIVIGRTNLGEADRIVRLLTPRHGKLSAVAKGVRKIKSRAGGHLELFGEVGLMLAEGRGSLDIITSARLAWYPHTLADNYVGLGLAYAFAGLIDRLAQERQAQPELYDHLAEALRAVNDGAAGSLVELWYKLRLLQLTGYRPELTACLSCGRRDATEYRFDAARGGIVCDACADAIARPISLSTIKLWRLLSDYPYATVAHITDGPTLATASLALCDEFYEHHIGKAFRPGIG
ncbi:MAG TPA: DNA repair protein RecO [Candidatus Saccharimonadia bacterium]|nr:DNA repair protein RecO [Candidatus Saccharimonadia bacterium]